MKIIKRDSSEEIFNGEKIYNAVLKANNATENNKLSNEQIRDVAEYVEYKCSKMGRAVSVEEIQDMVEDQIMAKGAFQLANRHCNNVLFHCLESPFFIGVSVSCSVLTACRASYTASLA